jgi:phytoene synthase
MSNDTAADRTNLCLTQTRERDFDAYVATLFAPVDKRPALYALHAFRTEIEAVRDKIREALPGEVRLQWWRDTLERGAKGDYVQGPLASAVVEAILRYRLPIKAFTDFIDAQTFDLYDDPMPSAADLEGFAGETAAAPLRLAALILADGDDPGSADAAGHAGVALAVARILRRMPQHRSRGQVYVPADLLRHHGLDRAEWLKGEDKAAVKAVIDDLVAFGERHWIAFRRNAKAVPRPVGVAFLPCYTVPLDFAAARRAGAGAMMTPITVSRWRRMASIFRGSLRV